MVTLKTARRLARITQTDLAKMSGVSQRTISELELGNIRNPSWDTACRIAGALGVEPKEIFAVPELPEAPQ